VEDCRGSCRADAPASTIDAGAASIRDAGCTCIRTIQ